MNLNGRKLDLTHFYISPLLAQNFMLIPNLKSDFQNKPKKSQKIGKAKIIKAKIKSLKWELIPHPPY